jgi:hypothetical protein
VVELISALFEKYAEVRAYLLDRGEPSYAAEIEAIAPKVLLLASASYCETCVMETLVAYFAERMGAADAGVAFVQNKALERQYHAMFDWKTNNVNKFWSLFGPDFKQYAEQRLVGDDELRNDSRAFVELGRLRNQLVHGNYLAFTLEKTSDEILDLAIQADRFVTRLSEVLNEFQGESEP